VSDTGIGIAAADLPRVFERFYQVDKTRGPRRGTGLGLAIAQEIVTAHGGTIWAESAGPGHGSTFRIWLPATPVEPARRDGERRGR
jgi:signal transduction histidine kinase